MSPTPDLPPKITPTQPGGGGHLYACCKCCEPPMYTDRIYYGGACTYPDRHTVPCLICGQKRKDPA